LTRRRRQEKARLVEANRLRTYGPGVN
jgi:hypothetical protein